MPLPAESEYRGTKGRGSGRFLWSRVFARSLRAPLRVLLRQRNVREGRFAAPEPGAESGAEPGVSAAAERSVEAAGAEAVEAAGAEVRETVAREAAASVSSASVSSARPASRVPTPADLMRSGTRPCPPPLRRARRVCACTPPRYLRTPTRRSTGRGPAPEAAQRPAGHGHR